MIYRNWGLIFTFISIIAISGCEYNLDNENNRNIPPPSPTHPFDLDLLSVGDTIKLFNITQFSCNFNTYGLDILDGEFILKNKTWNIDEVDEKFTISPNDYTPGYDTLKLVLFTNTKTGSLAEKMGAEAYMVSRKWLIIIDGTIPPKIKPSQSITKEGLLKLSWPKCNQFNFDAYELDGNVNSIHLSQIIKDADSNFYIDSNYIGGVATYRVRAKVFTDNANDWGDILVVRDSIPYIQFKIIGLDSLRIFWKKAKYKSKYKLVVNSWSKPDSTLLETTIDTSYIFTKSQFGKSNGFTLYTSPFHLSTTTTKFTQSDTKYYSMGKFLSSSGGVIEYAYNYTEKQLYVLDHFYLRSILRSIKISDLTYWNSYSIENTSIRGLCSCPGNSKQVAALSSDNILIFSNRVFQNPIIIPYNASANNIDHFYFTDNDLIALGTGNKYELVSISQKQVIHTINFDAEPAINKWAGMTTSKDGKYACYISQNGIRLYNIENSSDSLIYSDSRSYNSVLFDINNPSHLFLTLGNSLEIRNIPDFTLINSLPINSGNITLCNTDPESGYLLLTDFSFLQILDLNRMNIILKVQCEDQAPKLYGNKLFTKNGYGLDITNYLNK